MAGPFVAGVFVAGVGCAGAATRFLGRLGRAAGAGEAACSSRAPVTEEAPLAAFAAGRFLGRGASADAA